MRLLNGYQDACKVAFLPLWLILLVGTLIACTSSSTDVVSGPSLSDEAQPTSPAEAADISPTDTPEAIPQTNAVSETIKNEDEPAQISVEPVNPNIRVFQIIPEQSEVRFRIDELLLGNPKTVVGRTNEVNGEIRVDLDTYANSEVGPIQINARTLKTDDDFRNRALRRFILESSQDEFQFIIFTPTTVEGFPTEIAVGDTFHLQIIGGLAIRDITHPVTFEVAVTVVSDRELQGMGTATVTRTDFELSIPKVPGVANVADVVQLELDFVATGIE